MSEYTSYYVVKSTNSDDIKQKLNQAKVLSIVEVDENDDWFSDDYKRDGDYKWVVIATNEDHTKLLSLFSTMILFNQDEDLIRWDLTLYYENNTIYKAFYANESKDVITAYEQKIFEQVFSKPFIDIEPLLVPGKGGEFLNTVGIPYLEMLDQNLFYSLSPIDNNYALSSKDFDD